MIDGLNPEQREAVQTLSGPMLVLAGAGSGKTRVVTLRIANLIRHGTLPNRILAVTFTNKAAKEMKERVSTILGHSKRKRKRGEEAPPTPVIGTFHANCVQILRRHARTLGYPEKFAIMDRGDQESMARDVLRQLKVHSGMLKPGDLLSHISRWKNGGVKPDVAGDTARTDAEHVASSGYRKYQQAVKLAGAMDFDDLLLNTEHLFCEFEEVRKEEASRFDHVLVDEYQDTNQTQYTIIRKLAGDHRNLCVVGDDDQSIYGWRGAEVQHILNFKHDWLEAKVVRLEANYRSTSAILGVANQLIGFNKVRHDKVLKAARNGGKPPRVLQFKSEVEEAEGISEEIARIIDRREFEARDIAILFRTNEQPRVFETALRKAKVPYSLVGSQSFFDRREVKDLLSYLKVIDNAQDEVSLLRIINFPPRGIGPKSVETLLGDAVSKGQPVWESINDDTLVSKFPTPAREGIARLKGLIGRGREDMSQENVSLAGEFRQLLQRLSYMSVIERMYPNPEETDMRKASVEEMANAIGEYEASAKNPSLSGFLDTVALEGKEFGDSKEKNRGNSVSLMTYHSSKGLEFPIVYMVGMEEGILPHKRSITESLDDVEEERRLCYVGITRAQDELTLSLALQRMKWGKPRDTFVSRFLYEMTGQADNPNHKRAIEGGTKEARGARRPRKKGTRPGKKKKAAS